MNKSLENIKEEDTMKLFFSKTIKLISLRYMSRPAWVIIASWKKYETFRIKIANAFFKKDIFLVYPTSTNFTQRKRKPYDTNNSLALSRFNVVVCIHSLGKKLCCTYLKTTAWDDIFFRKNF